MAMGAPFVAGITAKPSPGKKKKAIQLAKNVLD